MSSDYIDDRKHNLVATTAPAVTDDSTQGYDVGSVWIVTSTSAHICLDATAGAAVWATLAEAA